MTELPQERQFGAVFPNEEYDERRRKVREAMAERDIDLLYVSSPRNITYLTENFDELRSPGVKSESLFDSLAVGIEAYAKVLA